MRRCEIHRHQLLLHQSCCCCKIAATLECDASCNKDASRVKATGSLRSEQAGRASSSHWQALHGGREQGPQVRPVLVETTMPAIIKKRGSFSSRSSASLRSKVGSQQLMLCRRNPPARRMASASRARRFSEAAMTGRGTGCLTVLGPRLPTWARLSPRMQVRHQPYSLSAFPGFEGAECAAFFPQAVPNCSGKSHEPFFDDAQPTPLRRPRLPDSIL